MTKTTLIDSNSKSLTDDNIWFRSMRALGSVTVVLPAYNVEGRIRETIKSISSLLENTGLREYEIIVVDDGSKDNTFTEAYESSIGPKGKLIVLRYDRNRGKGFALITGILHASKPYIAFIDADGDIPTRQLTYILAPLIKYDAAVTSKWHPQSKVEASKLRRILSKSFRTLVWALTGLKLHDTQTGAKAFRKEVLRSILPLIRTRKYAFDVELLVSLKRIGAKIIEVPCPATISLKGKQRIKTIIDMLLELLAITYRHRILKTRKQQ